MDANPYASPTIDADDHEPNLGQHKRGPLGMAVAGFFAGGFVGATAGAMAAGTIGFLFLISSMAGSREPDHEFRIETLEPENIVAFAFIGAIIGGIGGCVIGPIVGVVTANTLPSRRRGLAIGTAIALGLVGVGGGLLEGIVFADVPGLFGGALWLQIGTILGFGFGAVGGYVLGRGLGILAWGKVERVPPVAPQPVSRSD